MNLGDVKKSGLPRKYKFPVGRGHSSGIGKTCGRGRKGQKARQGTSFRPYFEGGQMSMLRRLPKFGFNNSYFKTDYEVVNVGDLEQAFAAGATVDRAALEASGLVRRECDGVKILGTGTLTKKLVVKAEAFAKSAEEKITKAGGSVEKLKKIVAAAIKHHAGTAEEKKADKKAKSDSKKK
ncbi:MAG TPA: 50S ribosomal protein L15 [Planctomycetota bacterium]|nr:50S ribosomal protein L15 [Planctomycetota bacterium]